MKRKLGIGFMALGTALIFSALFLLQYNRRTDAEAGKAADAVLTQVRQSVDAADTPLLPDVYDENTEMTEVEIDGYSYIGYVTIPSLKIDLPVMADWSDEQLKIAPCRDSGSAKTGNLVIAGHNYKKHFGPITRIKTGESVMFTDMDGKTRNYTVELVEVLQPEQTEEMRSGEWELTLYTCTYGGKTRVTARCREEECDSRF